MIDVFISYRREDRTHCEGIYRKLTAMGLQVWFDAGLTPGKDFDHEITNAVQEAKAVLVLWSPASINSEFILEEATIGQRRGALVVAQVAPCELPFRFGQTDYARLYNEAFTDQDAGWLKLLERIGDLTGRPGLSGRSQGIDGTGELWKRRLSAADLSDARLSEIGREAGQNAFRRALEAGAPVPVLDQDDLVFIAPKAAAASVAE